MTCTLSGVEFWIESDVEIDEDVPIEEVNILPPLLQDSPEKTEISLIIRWIVTFLSIFQTQFFLTNRALNWLLKFLVVLLQFRGKYSTKISELAEKLPHSLYQYNLQLSDIAEGYTFER